MKNLKLKAMLLGLAGASIMTNVFASEPPNDNDGYEPMIFGFEEGRVIEPTTTVDVVDAADNNIAVYHYAVPHLVIKSGNEPKLTITKFVGNTKDNDHRVVFYEGTTNIPNLPATLDGSLLTNKDKDTKIKKDAVIVLNNAFLEVKGKELFDLEKNALNDKVAPYLKLAAGFVKLTDNISKADAIKYGNIIKAAGSDTQLIVAGKLLDEHNKQINSLDIQEALDLQKNNVYSLDSVVNIQGQNVTKVVFTKHKGDNFHIDGDTMYIPNHMIAKTFNFDKGIKEVVLDDTTKDYGEVVKKVDESLKEFHHENYYGDIYVLANKDKNGDIITGGKDLTLNFGTPSEEESREMDRGSYIYINQGDTNNINAKINIYKGGVEVTGATANFNKEVTINISRLSNPGGIAIRGINGNFVFNDNVIINGGTIGTGKSKVVFNKDVLVNDADQFRSPEEPLYEVSNLGFLGGDVEFKGDLSLSPGSLALKDVLKFTANTVNLSTIVNNKEYGNLTDVEASNSTVNIKNLNMKTGAKLLTNKNTKFTATNVKMQTADTVAAFKDSTVNIQDLDMKDGATLATENSQVDIKGIFMDDKYHSKEDFNQYLKVIGMDPDENELPYHYFYDYGAIEFKNSDVKVSNMNIEGMNTVTFDNEKKDKVYTVDMLNVARGGEVLLNGGTLKVTKALTNSYVADKHLVENPPKPNEIYDPVGELILNKGTLDAENLRQLVTGELVNYNDVKNFGIKKEDFDAYKKAINKDKPFIILDENGVIKTKTSQIFAKGASAKEVDSGDVTNKSVFYVAGTLEFNDPKYTNEYVQAARKSLAKEPASTKVETIKSKTVIKMTGEEVKPTGEVVTETPLDTAVDNSNGTVTVENNKPVVLPEDKKDATKIVVGETADDKAIKVDGNLQAPTIDASKVTGLKEVEVNSGKTLTIGGMGKELITGLKDTKDMTYTVTGEQSTLKIGAKDKPVVDTTIGNLEIKDKAILEVNKTNLDVQGTFATNNGATIQIANSGSLSLANNKEEAPKVNISGDTTIMVGDKDTHGRLMLNGVALNGARVLIDPNWDSPYYSEVNLQDLVNNTLDGKLTVGKNSVLNVDPTQEDIDLTTTHEDANEAVLGVYTPTIVDPAKGSILVDPTLIGTEGENSILAADLPPNTVAMADNTVFYTKASTILDAADKNMGVLNAKTILLPAVSEEDDNYAAQAYISGSLADYAKLGNALNNDQKLYLVKAETPMDNGFKVVGFDDVADLINLKGQLAADKQGVELVYDNDKNKSVFNKVKDAFPGEKILLANNIDAALAGLVKDAQDPAKDLTKNPALNFLSDAIINTDRENVLNSMANMADLGGVTKESYNNLNKFTDTVENFSSQRNLWATYTHSNNNSDVDLTGNKASYSAKSNGLVLGGSLAQNDKQNWGMAVFYNKGKVTANSGLQTKNDVRSYGIGFYATNKLAKGEIVSQFAVSRNNNDLEQLGTKAKANTSNYSLAVKYQQPMAKANGTVTPYIGLRFAHLGGANFTNSLGFKYNVEASNVVSMPFGVKYAGQVVKGNTIIAPFAELGYTPVLSGKNHKVTVGLNATDSFTNTVLDNTWHAKVGANITKGNNTFGLSYARVQGHQTKDNQFMATAEFKF